jgi:outer membrane protein insertion porin family
MKASKRSYGTAHTALPALAFSLFLGFAFGLARAETAVNTVGNSVFGAADVVALARAGGWIPGQGTSGLSVLQEAYLREGYLQVSFEVRPGAANAAAGADSSVTLVVHEGVVARFGRVHVKGLKTRDERSVLDGLGVRPSAKFVPRNFNARIAELLESYDEAGFPFAQVWIDSLQLDAESNVVHLSLFVVEGRERRLETVDVEGAAKTRPDLVVRMSGLEPGRMYRGEMLHDAYMRLRSSGVFDDVEYPKLRVSGDGRGVDAVLVVDETQRSNSFTGALGYAAKEGGGGDQLSGLVQLRLNNIGGTLKDLHAFWTNDGRGRSETRLNYRDRFFLRRMLSVGLSLEQIGQDTLYTWQSAGAEVGRAAGRLGSNLIAFSLGFHADRNVFSDGPLLRSWRYRGTGGLSLARGDAEKRSFANLETRVTVARKTSHYRDDGGTIGVSQYILEFGGEGSVGLTRSLSLFMGLAYRGLESNEPLLPLSEQFYIGGARTLRGYRENQFHGRRVGTSRSELRLGSSAGENVFLFVDAGYVRQESAAADGGEAVVRRDLFKTGYGFGLRTRSQVGVIGLSFGFGDEVSLGRAKVHILLEQNF